MSADNFYVVRNHPGGGYTYLCVFASNTDEDGEQLYPLAKSTDPQFKTRKDAMNEASKLYSEYGYQYHWETYTKKEKKDFIKHNAPDEFKNITIEEVDALWRTHDENI